MFLPAHIVRQQAVGGGKRGPHLEHVEKYTSSYTSMHETTKGNLPQGEYRFFKGSKYPSADYAVCRCCGKYVNGKRERDEHKDKESCCGILDAAYRFLKECPKDQRVCLVCGKRTTEERFGIPLHGGKEMSSCENKFKFDYGEYSCKDDNLKYAIRVVKSRAFKKQQEYDAKKS